MTWYNVLIASLLLSSLQEDMYRASAIRALCKITDVSSLFTFQLTHLLCFDT